MKSQRFFLESDDYKSYRSNHWDQLDYSKLSTLGRYYHSRLAYIYKQMIPTGSRVIELGCGTGDLLDHLKPAVGVGIDFSVKAIEIARQKYPSLTFYVDDVHAIIPSGEVFDYVILSDLTNDLWDIQKVLSQVHSFCTPQTRIIFNFQSNLWNGPIRLAQYLGLAKKTLPQNWLTTGDLINFLQITDYEPLKSWSEINLPIRIPIISNIVNRYLAKIWPFSFFNFVNFVIARPIVSSTDLPSKVSVVIAARNEAGHIEELVNRIPLMGGGTEIIFVEGNSTDNTYAEIKSVIDKHPEMKIKLFKQSGRGKGDAVRKGFDEANGDILMILDADITVPPEDLPRFYNLLAEQRAEFVNGVRLVYPMQEDAMRFFNIIGNKFFSSVFTWLLGQPIRDSLCGTKVLWRRDYQRIAANRSYFGNFDPFGDFDLLFGAARLNLRIMEVPIRYRARTYGETNISRWKHGWLLLQMVVFAARRIKFI